MRYILDSNGYIESVSCTPIVCNNKGCTEYTGNVPEGYSSLEEWATTANVRAYKVVDGQLVYDSAKDTELQNLYKTEGNINYIEARVYSGQSVAKETLATIQYTPINKLGNGIGLSNGVITINNSNIKLISINAATRNTTWTNGGISMYLFVNGENKATNVMQNTTDGVLNATVPVAKGDQIEIKIYCSVAVKLENQAWSYLNVLAM